ncbi:hypothetical protein GMRT_11503 [Giardia muris]|uniref:Uncharacterized protein n=1 Tax=Giardia muris TaxID=5742 RepID=A0A4Z1SVI4_GIAMU|nr:hypothetical protein GMRT_11503 [Giardia muris]|eukprot:TNJ29806.1 hypothetical protein GMRT_11503 [Giardia muris]
MPPAKKRRQFEVVRTVDAEGRPAIALQEVTRPHKPERHLNIPDLDQMLDENGFAIIGAIQEESSIYDTKESRTEQDSDSEVGSRQDGQDDETIYTRFAIDQRPTRNLMEKTQRGVASSATLDAGKDFLIQTQTQMQEGLSVKDQEELDDLVLNVLKTPNEFVQEDVSGSELDALDAELDEVMNADIADMTSYVEPGMEQLQWDQYTNIQTMCLDLQRPHADEGGIDDKPVGSRFLIGTTRVVPASLETKKHILTELFGDLPSLTAADMAGLEYAPDKREQPDQDTFEREAREAAAFFAADDVEDRGRKEALSRDNLDKLRTIIGFEKKNENGEEGCDGYDDNDSLRPRSERSCRTSLTGLTATSRKSTRSFYGSRAMRCGRMRSEPLYGSDTIDSRLEDLLTMERDRISVAPPPIPETDEPFLTNAEKLTRLTPEAMEAAILENLYSMQDDENHGLDNVLDMRLFNDPEFYEPILQTACESPVQNLIKHNWNKTGGGYEKRVAAYARTIEDDEQDRGSKAMFDRPPTKIIIMPSTGVPVEVLGKFPAMRPEKTRKRGPYDHDEAEEHDTYTRYTLPSARARTEDGNDRKERKRQIKELKRERRERNTNFARVVNAERQRQALLQFRERSNVQGRRLD